jgi:hypothetical protein
MSAVLSKIAAGRNQSDGVCQRGRRLAALLALVGAADTLYDKAAANAFTAEELGGRKK